MNIIQRLKKFFSKDKSSLEKKIDLLLIQNNKSGNLSESKKENLRDFEIKSNNSFIKFTAIKEEKIIKNLPKIHLNKQDQDNLKGTLSNLVGGTANIGLTSMATNGLYMATANPSTLMQLSSGGVGSAVVNGGQITQQAGFVQAGTTIFTPMVVFQVASMITGQYYMNNISKQLNSVQEKLDELLNLFHIERQAKLVKSFQVIIENFNKTNFVIEDFIEIKIILSELANIREEYYLMLENSIETIKKNNMYSNSSSYKEAKKIALEFEKSGFLFKMKTSLISDELYHLTKMVEFHMNICFKNPDTNRINKLYSMLEDISSFNAKNMSFNRTQELYENIKEDTLHWIEYSRKESWFYKSEISDISKKIEQGFSEFENLKSDKISSLKKSYENFAEPFNDEKRIIIDNRNGQGDLYIE